MNSTEFHGTLPLAIGARKESEAEDGALDNVSQDFLVAWPGWRASLAVAGIVKNTLFPGYSRMFVSSFEPEQEDDDRAIVSVRGIGMLTETGDKRVREISSQGRVISIDSEGGFTTPLGTQDKWNINEPTLSLTDTYFTTTEPAGDVQGTAMDPPDPPAAPDYLWGSTPVDLLRYNYPINWVLEQRNSNEIIPGMLWAVRDTFAFYHLNNPG